MQHNNAYLNYITKEGHSYVMRKRNEDVAIIKDSLGSLEMHHSPTKGENSGYRRDHYDKGERIIEHKEREKRFKIALHQVREITS